MIKRVDGGWKVVSEKGKPLSKVLKTYSAAVKRLQEIEHFKKKEA